jgi:hypothetical protein
LVRPHPGLYDPAIKGWRIYWLDPATNAYYQQIGHQQGPDIVQEGTAENGASTRWSFTEITANSFHWKAKFRPTRALLGS